MRVLNGIENGFKNQNNSIASNVISIPECMCTHKRMLKNEKNISNEMEFFIEKAARVAHDISSPIAVMQITLDLLSQEIQNDNLNLMRVAIENIRTISNDLMKDSLDYQQKAVSFNERNFPKPEIQTQKVVLNSLIQELLDQKRREWVNTNSELIYKVSRKASTVIANLLPDGLKRVISNLLNNAIEACAGKPKIVVQLLLINESACISIMDNGVGMASINKESFLHGKSTKHLRRGFGLSGAREYMESIGGKLTIKSKINSGTQIKLLFNTNQF